jgi:hypothetical protein
LLVEITLLATTQEPTHPQELDADPPPTTKTRPPAKAICILLPVWGDEYIDQFFERSLPTLLAPGNIPALAKALPTHFVFLTRARDEANFKAHPAFRRLRGLVEVKFLPIDDLITSGNHSTTLTLAYARAVRQAGAAMLDTCFFFLVSDYIMADGSLAAVLARMQAGASAVQVGNFQLDSDAAEEWLQENLSDVKGAVKLNPRELMRWAFGCLHPISAASIVNFSLCHNTHANRLFWYVDEDTLIGRFYLLHMICIRPEIEDFIIGSSCDYSFVPEMCPSGNVVIIPDSDDYLVVEVQGHGHEGQFLGLGPGSADSLAVNLSEWTTARHRANAQETIVFHASSLPASLPAMLAEAERFIHELAPRLEPSPQPFRNHPYWLGAIAAFDKAIARRDSGMAESSLPLTVRAVRWIQSKILGLVPEVKRAHPRWSDLGGPLAVCKELTASNSRLLIGSSRSTPLSQWLISRNPDAIPFSLRRIMWNQQIRGARPGAFDAAFIELVDDYVSHMDEIVRKISPLLKPNGHVFLMAINTSWTSFAEHTGRSFAAGLGSLVRSKPWPDECRILSASKFRWRVNGMSVAAATALFERPSLSFPFHLIAAAVLLPLAIATNIAASWRLRPFVPGRIPTSVFVRLQVNCTTEGEPDREQASSLPQLVEQV